MANAGLGVPIKLLHESLGHIITVELKTGQLYRGKLAEGVWAWFEFKGMLTQPLLFITFAPIFGTWNFQFLSRG